MLQTQRLYYLDWLRLSAFIILILFHSWQPFTNFDWLIKSNHKSMVADIFTVFFHTWRRITKYSKLILLFSLPIIFIYIILKPIFPEYTSVTDFLTYTCIFIYGFVF